MFGTALLLVVGWFLSTKGSSKYLIQEKYVLTFVSKLKIQSCHLSWNRGCGYYVDFGEPHLALSLTHLISVEWVAFAVSAGCVHSGTYWWKVPVENVLQPVLAGTNEQQYFCHVLFLLFWKAYCYGVRSGKKLLPCFSIALAKQALVTLGWKLCQQLSWDLVTGRCRGAALCDKGQCAQRWDICSLVHTWLKQMSTKQEAGQNTEQVSSGSLLTAGLLPSSVPSREPLSQDL